MESTILWTGNFGTCFIFTKDPHRKTSWLLSDNGEAGKNSASHNCIPTPTFVKLYANFKLYADEKSLLFQQRAIQNVKISDFYLSHRKSEECVA